MTTPSPTPPPAAPTTPSGRPRIDPAATYPLPVLHVALTPALAALAFGGLVALAFWIIRPAGDGLRAGLTAGTIVAGVVAGGTLLFRPWAPRAHTRWPVLLLGIHGVVFAGVLTTAGLLYSATHPELIPFAVGLSGALIVALLVQASGYARAVARATHA